MADAIIEKLNEILVNDDYDVHWSMAGRIAAAKALGDMGEEDAEDFLMEFLKDGGDAEPSVEVAVIEALAASRRIRRGKEALDQAIDKFKSAISSGTPNVKESSDTWRVNRSPWDAHRPIFESGFFGGIKK